MVAAKQAHNSLAKTKPWSLPKQSYFIDVAITELLSGHELLYAPIPLLDFAFTCTVNPTA